MDNQKEQRLADAALQHALLRVCKAYNLVPAEPTVVDYLEAYHGICAEIMHGAFAAVREATNGEA